MTFLDWSAEAHDLGAATLLPQPVDGAVKLPQARQERRYPRVGLCGSGFDQLGLEAAGASTDGPVLKLGTEAVTVLFFERLNEPDLELAYVRESACAPCPCSENRQMWRERVTLLETQELRRIEPRIHARDDGGAASTRKRQPVVGEARRIPVVGSQDLVAVSSRQSHPRLRRQRE